MNRLDDLLRGERERVHRLRVEPPAFGEIRARGVRRRARRRAATVGSVAALAAVVVLGGQAVLDDSVRETLPPATSPAPVPPEKSPRAAEEPELTLLTLAVAPENPDVRASLWWRCLKGCQGGKIELVLTRDGFATSTSVPLPDADPEVAVTALGGESFHVTHLEGSLVARADGSSAPVRIEGGPGPAAEGETIVRSETWGGRLLALDPDTAVAHPLSIPDPNVDLVAQPDGTLLGWMWTRREGTHLVWSSDRGRTWREKALAVGGKGTVVLLPSARAGVLAAVESADAVESDQGSALFPWARVHRSTDGGTTWSTTEIEGGPAASVGRGGIMADGRLVLDVDEWVGEEGVDVDRHVGLHATDDEDWSRLTLTRARPTDVSQGIRIEATARGLVVSATNPGVGVVDVSRDAGQTWRRLTAR